MRQEKERESQGLESEGRLRASLAEGDRGASDYSCLQHLSTSDWGLPAPRFCAYRTKGLIPMTPTCFVSYNTRCVCLLMWPTGIYLECLELAVMFHLSALLRKIHISEFSP